MADIAVVVNGRAHRLWQRISITRSLERACHLYQVNMAFADPLRVRQQIAGIKSGGRVEIAYDGAVMITGYVDDLLIRYDASQCQVTLNGRSLAADLVDSTGPERRYKKATVADIARDVARLFGIEVEVACDVGAAFADVVMNGGESYFWFLERLARMRQVRLTSTERGALLLTRGSTGAATARLECGKNILDSFGMFSLADRYQTYTVAHQAGRAPRLSTAAAVGSVATATDSAVARKRTYYADVFGAKSSADAQAMAQWEARTRAGRGQRITVTVSGVQNARGQLWQAGDMVEVLDPVMDVAADMMIVEARITVETAGATTQLDLMPPSAMTLEPLAESVSGWGA